MPDDAKMLRLLLEFLQQEKSAFLPARTHRRLQRIEPFPRFVRISVCVRRSHRVSAS